jgi:hypothetical protein
MLVQIFHSCEAGACAAFAIWERTEMSLLRTAVLFVYFAFVAKETTRVSEAWKFLAPRDVAFVRPIVFVHVFSGVSSILRFAIP